jgi:hypothetical protein
VINPYVGPVGYMTGLPIAVQLVSDVMQARMKAASSVAGSVADAINVWTTTMGPYTNPMMMMGGYRAQGPIVTPPPASSIRVNSMGSTRGVTVTEGDENFLAHLELPNVNADDITVKAGDQRVEVNAGGSVSSFALPQGVDIDAIAAEYRDGILTLRMPKEAKSARREIKVHAAKPAAPKA